MNSIGISTVNNVSKRTYSAESKGQIEYAHVGEELNVLTQPCSGSAFHKGTSIE